MKDEDIYRMLTEKASAAVGEVQDGDPPPSPEFLSRATNPGHLGEVASPDGYATEQGECGDAMMVFLAVAGRVIRTARFDTLGCGYTVACGDAAMGRCAAPYGTPWTGPESRGRSSTDRREETPAMDDQTTVRLKPIGEVRSPYHDWAPHQPVEREAREGAFRLVLHPEFAEGLRDLERFAYAYVLTHLDRGQGPASLTASPPWAGGKTVGVFASRSPARPNPIGLSIVRVLRVEGVEVVISPIDLFDRTAILDIKPYFKDLDAKTDANRGWADDLEDPEHAMLHVRGLPHGEHHHGNGHGHGSGHGGGGHPHHGHHPHGHGRKEP